MIKTYLSKVITLIVIVVSIWNCNSRNVFESSNDDEAKIRKIHIDYVNGWLKMDKDKVMSLLEENAMIQPNRIKPIEGKENIRKFWFPNDSSLTVINNFETEIIFLYIIDSIAITTHNSLIDWTYKKDTTTFGMLQKGVNTTIYRKQINDSWKIWRSMWTDLYFKEN